MRGDFIRSESWGETYLNFILPIFIFLVPEGLLFRPSRVGNGGGFIVSCSVGVYKFFARSKPKHRAGAKAPLTLKKN